MPEPRRIYLDNAATSFPKPSGVHSAMASYSLELGASPGRGTYRESVEGGRLIAQCRSRIARLLNHPSAEHIVFTLNASDALNLAIKGVVRRAREERVRSGSAAPVHVVTTSMDHNSVLRPLNALAAEAVGPAVEWTCVEADPVTGLVDPGDIRVAIRPGTVLVAAVHASNVSGSLQPIGAFGEVCRAAGVPLLVDAAQTAGRLRIDMEGLGVDLLAAPGHKHLLGPLGTGLLAIRPGLEQAVSPMREGGTGSVSELDTQPETMPDRYEPGSHNTPGLVGLSAGVGWIRERGVDAVWAHERELIGRTTAALADAGRFPGLSLLGPRSVVDRVGVFSVVHDALPPAELANILESEFGVLTRAGIHCAPRAHATFGTISRGGATRFSFGPFTTADDADAALDALAEICAHSTAFR